MYTVSSVKQGRVQTKKPFHHAHLVANFLSIEGLTTYSFFSVYSLALICFLDIAFSNPARSGYCGQQFSSKIIIINHPFAAFIGNTKGNQLLTHVRKSYNCKLQLHKKGFVVVFIDNFIQVSAAALPC